MSVLAAPNAGFLLRHPAHFIALGFGAGLSPVAPGTLGTLLAIPLAALLRTYLPDTLFGAAIVMVALWRRRFGTPPANDKEKARQVRFLQSRGFSLSAIIKLLRNPPGDDLTGDS